MIVILGLRDRETDLTTGQFHCPKCDTIRPYKHKRIATYFTLFFIPLFPVNKRGEYIECQVCRRAFKPGEVILG